MGKAWQVKILSKRDSSESERTLGFMAQVLLQWTFEPAGTGN